VETTNTSRFPGGGGSRRDEEARERVLAATTELLAETGYAALTVEGVAARAGVGKPTIYRWWKNKADLAYDASCATTIRSVPPDTGEFETDLRGFLDRCARFLWRDDVSAALRGMLADPQVLDAIDKYQARPARLHFRRIVDGGVAAGAVRADVDADALFDLAVGAIMSHALRGTRPRSQRAWVTSIVSLLLDGLEA
jgi:AcrR family transcriptional regulator